ncbi:MAG: response regulator, partial [Pseudomonadota bacterium]
SEMVQKRRELRTALDQAETADREKTAFLGRMSHELRTPANGIVGGTDLLRETHLDGDQEGVLTILEESSARMMRLIEDILAYSEISDRAVKARAEPVDMAALVAGIFLDYQAETAAQGVKLICELPETGGAIVRSDALLMRRMVDKLVSNAVKFTDKGSVTVRLRFPDPGRLKVIVADTGIGIAPPDMQRIFSRFEQADGAKTRARDGIGLGLSTAQELARLLGGHIQAASDLGLGSTFTIDLKVRRLPGPEARRTLPEKLHVLVAEDNRTNRLLIEKMFKNMPQRLVFANDGLQAVEMYRSEPPDVVLMDISMPNMDGIDATRGIRAHEESDRLPRCPIVAVTANASDDDRQRCFEAGMDGFLAKPLRKTHLMETMGRILT